MNRTTPEQHTPRTLSAEAAEWFAKLHTPACTDETRQEFTRWLNADPEHELAYEQCRTLWLISGSLKTDPDLRRELAGAYQHIEEVRTGKSSIIRKGVHRWKWPAQIAAAILIGMVFIYTGNYQAPQEYITQVGEQRLIQLADGSSVMLNTNTKISVRFSTKKRHIDLIHGEAYFDVNKDPQRPFDVIASNSRVRAVGTEFNVALLNQAVSVAVTEGIVEFATSIPFAGSSNTTKLQVGDGIAWRTGDSQLKIQPANIARISAWKIHKIYFDNNTLAEAIAEYNRYSTQKFTVVDADLNQQRITGIFHVGDLDAFIFSLEQGLDARVVRMDGDVLVMKR